MNCAGPSEEITDFLVHVSTCVYELCLSKLTHHPSQLRHFKGAISLIQLRANGQDGSRYSRLSLTQAAFAALTDVQNTDLIFIRNSQDLNTVRETVFDDATSDR